MINSSITALAILLGISIYPFFANHLPNQRQNASAVIGVVLLGCLIFGHGSLDQLEHAMPAHVALNVLSFLFFAAGFLGRRRGTVVAEKSALLPFGIGVIAAAIDVFANLWEVHAVLFTIQAICLLAITKTYSNLPKITLFKAAYFVLLYAGVNAWFHIQTLDQPASIDLTWVMLTYCVLLVTCVFHMGFQDFSRTRTKKGWDGHSKIDQDLMKMAFRGRRVLKDFRHDLRQPLSTLGILASVGKAISKDPEVTARYQHIQTAQKALKNMLEDFFDQLNHAIRYPVDEGNAPLQQVSIHEVLCPLVEEYRMLADVKQLQIRYVPSNLTVLSNREALTKILRNGLDNAIKYTNKGGVVVGVRRKNGKTCLQIADTGPGVENNHVAAHNKGWGHGSNIVRDLSEQILAKTDCRNRYFNKKLAGSVFEVIFPEQAEIAQRGKLSGYKTPIALEAQVMAMSNEHLIEIQRRLPVQGFDKVDFHVHGAYRSYLGALRRGMASVYIMYAGDESQLHNASQQLKLLGSMLDFEPCCILIYCTEMQSNAQIEFTREMIRIPISSRQNDMNLNVIAELFPAREHTDMLNDFHPYTGTGGEAPKKAALVVN